MATHPRPEGLDAAAPAPRILIVDDDPNQVLLARETLQLEGLQVDTALSGTEALKSLEQSPKDLVIADLRMPGMDGFDLLHHVHARWPGLPVIFLTGLNDVSRAVEAMQIGAENYLSKPLDIQRLRFVIRRALERKALQDDNARLRRMVWGQQASFGTLIGRTQPMLALYGAIEAVGPTSSTILILGESGTGKELISREIHRCSSRADGPFIPVNCAALPGTLLETELFGHAKGAFTGASAAKVGLFEAATGGTIFLDEIGSTSPETQQSLLRVLQEREIRRVGETGSRSVDVRVISATNANLENEIRAGRFRSDLYFRLGRVILRVPTLRDRVEDIPLLADHFLAASCRRQGRKLCRLSPRAVEKLMRYSWPGNIRELENVIEGAVIFAQRGLLGPSDLSIPQMDEGQGQGSVGEDLSLQAVMRDHITRVLERCGGNKKQAAMMLGIPRTSLYKRMKRLGLE